MIADGAAAKLTVRAPQEVLPPPNNDAVHANVSRFPTTQWTRLEQSRASAAWDYDWFCQNYREAIVSYFRARLPKDDAEDVAQEFFERVVLRGRLLERADRERGSLRGLIASATDRFVADHWRRIRTLKRGRGNQPMELTAAVEKGMQQDEAGLMPDVVTPDLAFDRSWASHLLTMALAATCRDYASKGKRAVFDAVAPELDGSGPKRPRAELGAELGMTAREVTLAVSDLRQRLAKHFIDEVARTIGSEANLEEELRALRDVLR